ncbi:MAG: hypothetical protein EBZ77_11750, partial [Chitinophagia bacterium]|nr:hypothetical protein [Chitinophagia bacterium]
MRSVVLALLAFCSYFSLQAKDSNTFPISGQPYFLENKGQIKDEFGKQRTDIQFVVTDNASSVYVGPAALHYQFAELLDDKGHYFGKQEGFAKKPVFVNDVRINRVDVVLVGANSNAAAEQLEKTPYYQNEVVKSNAGEKSEQLGTCKKIVYKNVYNDIDWVIYVTPNGTLKHEFIVGAHGDVHNIKLRYNGQRTIDINSAGDLVVTCNLGSITELAPVCYNVAGEKINSSFHLQGNELSYNVAGSGAMTIDPILKWGTYYGRDSNNTQIQNVLVDANHRIVMCGQTNSTLRGTIATSGAYDTVLTGGIDAFMAAFDSTGARLWSTYFGGDSDETGVSLCVDRAGNYY